MLFWAIVSLIFLFLLVESYFLNNFRKDLCAKKERLAERITALNKELEPLTNKIETLEQKMSQYFFFYDLIRQIAPLSDKRELFRVFGEEIKYLGTIEEVRLAKPYRDNGYLRFKTGEEETETIYVKTASKKIAERVPLLEKLLKLCTERINLYEKFQQLSIYDTLTEIYNRRYFMDRYFEEFERSQSFALSLSFLMLDIDNFKNINDTYGHLVGDGVLKDVAKFIKENIREIDSAARFGGEEFVIMLPETVKTGAIMVAERICSKISQAKIKVFDETLNVTVSMGVASFPQNTLHDDVLIEIADKALYKAKISGKNRVCWF